MRSFKGRVAVVTGGASGIGLGLARRFVQEGMKVVIGDVETAALESAHSELSAGGEVLAVEVDVANAEQVQLLADRAFEHFGGVHILCNNAGVGESISGHRLWEQPLEEWQWLMEVNVWSVVYGLRAFVPRMLQQGSEGHVLNTASVAGLVDAGGIYGATKHAGRLHQRLTLPTAQGQPGGRQRLGAVSGAHRHEHPRLRPQSTRPPEARRCRRPLGARQG